MKNTPRMSYGFYFAIGVIAWCVVMICVGIVLITSTHKAGNAWWNSLLWKCVFLPADLLSGTIGRWGEFISVVSWHLLLAVCSGFLVARMSCRLAKGILPSSVILQHRGNSHTVGSVTPRHSSFKPQQPAGTGKGSDTGSD
jgi:hypothetical protein